MDDDICRKILYLWTAVTVFVFTCIIALFKPICGVVLVLVLWIWSWCWSWSCELWSWCWSWSCSTGLGFGLASYGLGLGLGLNCEVSLVPITVLPFQQCAVKQTSVCLDVDETAVLSDVVVCDDTDAVIKHSTDRRHDQTVTTINVVFTPETLVARLRRDWLPVEAHIPRDTRRRVCSHCDGDGCLLATTYDDGRLKIDDDQRLRSHTSLVDLQPRLSAVLRRPIYTVSQIKTSTFLFFK